MSRLARLPGIGPRSAERLAFYLLKSERDSAMQLAQAITDVKNNVRHCSICYNFTEQDPCPLCSNPERQHETILVVEQPKDLISLEQTGMYQGGYHVLMGRLAPLDGVEPGDLTIRALLDRVDHAKRNAQGVEVSEVVFGLSPNLEGDGTVLYLTDQLSKRDGIRLSRLARGLPSGSQIEYASKAVLADALLGRQTLDGAESGSGKRRSKRK